ncbi:MAG: non-ribosomal peptide synthetase, partial [Nitrospirae bacterium]
MVLPRSTDPSATSTRVIPLSFAQERLWFLDQLEPGNPAYNLVWAFALSGDLQESILEEALTEVVRRHEALRTTFPLIDGAPTQQISPDPHATFHVLDVRQVSATVREAHVHELMRQEARWRFDVTQGPLVRVTLYRLAAREWRLLLVLHHLVCDAWSLEILLQEWIAGYVARLRGQPPQLPAVTVQYQEFTRWQREEAHQIRWSQQLAYWGKQLAGCPPLLDLPTDKPRPAVQSFEGSRVSFTLPQDLTSALVTLSRQERVTMFMVLLAAFHTMLFRYTGQEDIVVGVPVAGRTRKELEKTIGLFANTLAIRVNCSSTLSFQDLLRQVRRVVLE